MRLFVCILLCISFEATACKCGPYDIDENFTRAKKVYLGELIAAKTVVAEPKEDGRVLLAKLLVSESFKGNVFDIEEFKMEDNTCEISLTLKETILIFEDEKGYTNSCNGSFQFSPYHDGLNEKEVVKDLRLLKKYLLEK